MTKEITFPTWFTVLTVLLFISNLFIFGLGTLLDPSLAFPESDSSAHFPIQFFAVRHIAFSIPLFHGLIKKNPMVFTGNVYHVPHHLCIGCQPVAHQ